MVSDHMLKKVINTIEKSEAKETKTEVYDMARYFESRKVLIKTANLLVSHGFKFEVKELEFIYRAFLNYIEISMWIVIIENHEFLQLLKDFCLLALRSPKFPKDRSLLEIIDQFPPGVVKMSTIMADLHKYISSKQGENSDEDEFDLEEMGETVVKRYIDESINEFDMIDEIKSNLKSILNLDFELDNIDLLTPIVSAHREDNQNAAIMFMALVSKHKRNVAQTILLEVIRSDFELFFQSLICFSEMTIEKQTSSLQRSDDIIKLYEVSFCILLQTLQMKKTENSDKKINLLMLCVRSISHLVSDSSNKNKKKIGIQLVFTLNDFLLGKIPTKFLEDTVLKIIEKDTIEDIEEYKKSLIVEHRESFEILVKSTIENKKNSSVLQADNIKNKVVSV